MQQAVSKAFGESGAAREDNIAKQRLAKVHIRSVDCVNDNLMHACIFEADDLRVEENLGSSVPFRAYLQACQYARDAFKLGECC